MPESIVAEALAVLKKERHDKRLTSTKKYLRLRDHLSAELARVNNALVQLEAGEQVVYLITDLPR
jgi:hypothetical protein